VALENGGEEDVSRREACGNRRNSADAADSSVLQEVDPTWYDPWTVTSKATLHHLQEERKADLAHRKKIKSAAGTQQGQKKPQTQASIDRKPPQKVAARN
jgi:hypothetical protein